MNYDDTCTTCQGYKYIFTETGEKGRCPACDGTGKFSSEKTLEQLLSDLWENTQRVTVKGADAYLIWDTDTYDKIMRMCGIGE